MLIEFWFYSSFSLKDMSAALNERNKENRQDNLHNLETNLNNDGETHNSIFTQQKNPP